MENSITLVTPPDDINIDALRIFTYDLQPDQSQMLSDAFSKIKQFPPTVVYVFKRGDDIKWLLDKKQKCSIMFYNAESLNQTVVGYLAAHRNSFYFGNLMDLSSINNNRINDIESLIQIMEVNITKYAL
jgi:hypothetical protein